MEQRADPTEATTAALWREVASLEKLFNQRIESVERAIEVAHEDATKFPTEVQEAVRGLRELIHADINTLRESFRVQDEKFNGIQKQFQERDIAVSAALQAAKEAVGKQQEANDRATTKSESSTNSLISQQGKLAEESKAILGARIDALKESLAATQLIVNTIQTFALGRVENSKDQRDSVGMWIGIGGFVLAVVIVLVGILVRR